MNEDEEWRPLTGIEEQGQEKETKRSRFALSKIWTGPSKPRSSNVTMFLKSWQLMPEKMMGNVQKRSKIFLLIVFWLIWLFTNVYIAHKGILSITVDKSSDPHASPTTVPLLECGYNRKVWLGPNFKCGLNGEDCSNHRIGTRFTFKCPVDCERSGWTYEPWPIGNYTAMREPVVIGGPTIYRGDSFVCAAALHAGLISRHSGGCAQIEWVGPHSGFESVPSKDGKFSSLGFDAEFPVNFKFVNPENDVNNLKNCKDISAFHIVVDVIFILIAAYFIPTASTALWYLYTLGCFGFWTVILASNPPIKPGTSEGNAELISLGVQRMLPCFLGLFVIYITAAKPQLENMHASLSRLLFWGGGFTVGVLENYAFGFIPIDRLMISDLNSQAGAWLALGIISCILVLVVFGQAYTFWIEGKFRKYLKIYLTMILALVLLSLCPGQTLRLHHYFFALLLLPGTGLKTTCSLFYQGLLVGLYIAGVARWDFDSVLQNAVQLSRGASLQDSAIASLGHEGTSLNSTIIHWMQQPPDFIAVGYSLVLNDVECVRSLGDPNPYVNETVQADGMVNYAFNLTKWVYEKYSASEIPQKWYVRVATAFTNGETTTQFSKYTDSMVLEF